MSDFIRRRLGPRAILGNNGLRSGAEDIFATRNFQFPPGGGPSPVLGPVGPPPAIARSADSPFLRQIAPPWTTKIGPASKDFGQQNFELTLAAGAGSTVILAGLRLPSDNVGWIQQFQLYVLAPNNGTSIIWTLRQNQGPVQGFDAKRNPPGIANLILVELNDLQIPADAGVLIDVLITNNNANGPWTVGAGFAGWHHPRVAELDYWGPR